MATNLDDSLAPLDLSMRPNSNNNDSGTTNPPNRNQNRPQSRLIPPPPLPQNMGAPPSTSFETYSHSQAPAPQADAQHFPRGFQPTPGQFFNPVNVLNLDPQPKPWPVPPTNNFWNRNNNRNCNQTANPGSGNINGSNDGPLIGFRLPWINPYDNYPYQSSINNCHLLPGGQMLMSPLFPFQQQPNQIPSPSPSYHNNYCNGNGNGNNPYAHPQRSHCREQPGPSAFHPPPTHSSYNNNNNNNNNWAQSNSAFYRDREETQGDRNGLGRNTPEVISVVNSGFIQFDTDDGDVTFLGYGSSINIRNEAGNENETENDKDRADRPPALSPHGPVEVPVPAPSPNTNFNNQPESQDIRSDAAPKRKENEAAASGTGTSSRAVSSSTEDTVKDPTYKIRVCQFGVSKKAEKPIPYNFEKAASEKSGRSGDKSLKNSGKRSKASTSASAPASAAIPSLRLARENKGPIRKTGTAQKSSVPFHKTHCPASRAQQSQGQMELKQDASSRLAGPEPENGSKKGVNWLLVHPETDENEMDSLAAITMAHFSPK